MLNEMVAEFVAPDPHDFTMHFFVLKSLVFHTHEKAVRLTNCNFVTDIEKVLMDYFATISLVIKERAAKISFSKGKNQIGKFPIQLSLKHLFPSYVCMMERKTFFSSL